MTVIFNQRGLFCQISIALIVLVLSNACATQKISTTSEIVATYNSLHPNGLESRPDGSVSANLFFDPAPSIVEEQSAINVVLLTRNGSKFGYDLDLRSGALFHRRYHCEHRDIWDKYKGDLSTPPFSVAILPRTLDALGEPQQVFYFSDAKYLQPHGLKSFSHQARVVGGVLRQVCREYPCQLRERWLSNMQLIAVNPDDPRFKDITTMAQLKSRVNWEEASAWMQNGFGVTITGIKPEPVYRITGEIEAVPAIDYLFKKDRQIDFQEQKSMVNSCHHIYENLWEKAQKARNAINDYMKLRSKRADTLDSADEFESTDKLAIMREQREIERINKQVSLREARAQANFGQGFKDFHQEFGKRYKTCMRFVRPAAHVLDAQKFWFFAYIDLFMEMENLGWRYSCSRKGWIEENYRSQGLRAKHIPLDESCTTQEVDMAFDTAIAVMKREQSLNRPHLRFITYDSGVGGSHQKIYSWVTIDGKELVCTDKKEQELLKNVKFDIFPEEIRWKNFGIDDKRFNYDVID
jgi:hypothetical protein